MAQVLQLPNADDRAAEWYMKATVEERRMFSQQLAKYPTPRPLKILWVVGLAIMVGLLGFLDYTWFAHPELELDKVGMIAFNLFVLLIGVPKLYFTIKLSRPSVYNMLMEYKARHGCLPPE